ncbi:unnamed protein product, partial [Brugia timori]|uniref:Inorganic diphosphatase n=1 Tax=Brugia timori TaxID=42155 RepID=A0A0R3R1C4_9BILA
MSFPVISRRSTDLNLKVELEEESPDQTSCNVAYGDKNQIRLPPFEKLRLPDGSYRGVVEKGNAIPD